jgi:hypothetical protein
MSSPQNQRIALNPLIPFVKIKFKSWRSEAIQLDILELEIKKQREAAKAAFSYARKSATGARNAAKYSIESF